MTDAHLANLGDADLPEACPAEDQHERPPCQDPILLRGNVASYPSEFFAKAVSHISAEHFHQWMRSGNAMRDVNLAPAETAAKLFNVAAKIFDPFANIVAVGRKEF